MSCENCDDGEGRCLYPYYGMAPHAHNLTGGSIIGSTILDPRETWPKNFVEDPDCEGCGTYTKCPDCGGFAFVVSAAEETP